LGNSPVNKPATLKHHVPLREVGHAPCRALGRRKEDEGGVEKEDVENGGSVGC
jgi:hypothetical protein